MAAAATEPTPIRCAILSSYHGWVSGGRILPFCRGQKNSPKTGVFTRWALALTFCPSFSEPGHIVPRLRQVSVPSFSWCDKRYDISLFNKEMLSKPPIVHGRSMPIRAVIGWAIVAWVSNRKSSRSHCSTCGRISTKSNIEYLPQPAGITKRTDFCKPHKYGNSLPSCTRGRGGRVHQRLRCHRGDQLCTSPTYRQLYRSLCCLVWIVPRTRMGGEVYDYDELCGHSWCVEVHLCFLCVRKRWWKTSKALIRSGTVSTSSTSTASSTNSNSSKWVRCFNFPFSSWWAHPNLRKEPKWAQENSCFGNKTGC